MKIYLASRYSRHDEMQGVRDVLEALGHKVTSRWIDLHPEMETPLEKSLSVDQLNGHPELCDPYAQVNLDDMDAAECLISFTGGGLKGGRHVEFGYCLAKNKRMIVVGPRENVFHTLTGVEWYLDWPAFARVVSTWAVSHFAPWIKDEDKTPEQIQQEAKDELAAIRRGE